MKHIIDSTPPKDTISLRELSPLDNGDIVIKDRDNSLRLGIIHLNYNKTYSIIWNIGDTGYKQFENVKALLEWYIPGDSYKFYWLNELE